jgi:hypothetical protein
MGLFSSLGALLFWAIGFILSVNALFGLLFILN